MVNVEQGWRWGYFDMCGHEVWDVEKGAGAISTCTGFMGCRGAHVTVSDKE